LPCFFCTFLSAILKFFAKCYYLVVLVTQTRPISPNYQIKSTLEPVVLFYSSYLIRCQLAKVLGEATIGFIAENVSWGWLMVTCNTLCSYHQYTMKCEASCLKAVTLEGKGYRIFVAAVFTFDTGKAFPCKIKLANATLPLLP
jgi:hypothetical protein